MLVEFSARRFTAAIEFSISSDRRPTSPITRVTTLPASSDLPCPDRAASSASSARRLTSAALSATSSMVVLTSLVCAN